MQNDFYYSDLFKELFKIENNKIIEIKAPTQLPKQYQLDIWRHGTELLVDSGIKESYYITLDFIGMDKNKLTPVFRYHSLSDNTPGELEIEECYDTIQDAIEEMKNDITEYIGNILANA